MKGDLEEPEGEEMGTNKILQLLAQQQEANQQIQTLMAQVAQEQQRLAKEQRTFLAWQQMLFE